MKIIYLLVILYLTFINKLLYAQDYTNNYCEALKYSLLFYKVQRAGKLPDNSIPWRGDTVLGDSYDGIDLSGGYFDAGDGVKFGFPQAYTMTLLSMVYLQYQNNIVNCGLDSLYKDVLKYGIDYIIKAHVSDNVFVGQIAEGEIDHGFWGPPENITYSRQVYTIDSSSPGTDLAMEASAALSAASIVFSNDDSSYSSKCLSHSKSLYSFAMNSDKKVYSDSITDAANFYLSSGYVDEISWASVWLYKATRNSTYLSTAESYYNNNDEVKYANQLSWDQKGVAIGVLLYQITNTESYLNNVKTALNYWQVGGGINYTPGGLAYLSEWGPTRYAMNMAFIATIVGGDVYTNFANGQLEYVLGYNPNSYSYLIGWGEHFPKNPHHRAAHHSETFNISNPTKNTYTLYGALVGGPSINDSYADDRTNYIQSEVALDYNVGLIGTLAKFCSDSAIATYLNPFNGVDVIINTTVSLISSSESSSTIENTQSPTTNSTSDSSSDDSVTSKESSNNSVSSNESSSNESSSNESSKESSSKESSSKESSSKESSSKESSSKESSNSGSTTHVEVPSKSPAGSDESSNSKSSTDTTNNNSTDKPSSSTTLPSNTDTNDSEDSGSISIHNISSFFISSLLLFLLVL